MRTACNDHLHLYRRWWSTVDVWLTFAIGRHDRSAGLEHRAALTQSSSRSSHQRRSHRVGGPMSFASLS